MAVASEKEVTGSQAMSCHEDATSTMNEILVSCNIIAQQEAEVHLKNGAYRDMQEQGFFAVKFFTLQEVTITIHSYAREMPVHFDIPSSNTIDDVCAKSIAIKISGNEKV